MTSGLVNASISFPEGQAVKMIFFLEYPIPNCRHSKQPTFRNATTGVNRKTSAEIPYWWRVATQIWVVLLIGHPAWKICFSQSEALHLPRSRSWRVISMELNFCACFSDVISRRNQCWRRKMTAVFSRLRIKLNLLFTLLYLKSNFALTLDYLSPALNNPAQMNQTGAPLLTYQECN